MVQHEHAFEEDRPFDQCHASSLAETEDGSFLVAFFAGAREKADDTAIWLSRRDPDRWHLPQRIAKVCDEPHWNPVLFQPGDGRVCLFFKVGREISHWRTWWMNSPDQGRTWTLPRLLVGDDEGGRGPVKNKPIVLAGGEWLAGASVEPHGGHWDVFVDRSEDGGRTWQTSPVPCDRTVHVGLNVIQPTLWESRPGQVHMLVRSSGGRLFRSDSHDDGRTWCPLQPTSVPNNNSGIDAVRLEDGTLALACNPVSGDFGPRTPLSLLVSCDNGRTWTRRLDLETAPGAEFSYPSVIRSRSGIAVSYTWRRRHIAWWHGDVETVRDASHP
jgi:predicted neuraminidase